MLKQNKKPVKEKSMKKDIIFFAIMFALAWVGFIVAKDRIPALSGKPVAERTNNFLAQPSPLAPSETDFEKENLANATTASSKEDASSEKSDDSSVEDPSSEDIKSEDSKNLTPEESVERVLAEQMKAWNRGDLDGFMSAYWNDPNLTFSGGGPTTKGWDETYASYRERYPEDKMGTIKFLDIKTEMVGDEAAIVNGRFKHKLPTEDVRGSFSLVLKKFDDGWKIIHDQTLVAK